MKRLYQGYVKENQIKKKMLVDLLNHFKMEEEAEWVEDMDSYDYHIFAEKLEGGLLALEERVNEVTLELGEFLDIYQYEEGLPMSIVYLAIGKMMAVVASDPKAYDFPKTSAKGSIDGTLDMLRLAVLVSKAFKLTEDCRGGEDEMKGALN